MKTPLFHLQYELPVSQPYTENGSDTGAKLYIDLVDNDEVRHSLLATGKMSLKELLRWFATHPDNDTVVALPFTTRTPEALDFRLDGRKPRLLYIMRPLHTIDRLDDFLYSANAHLDDGATICCHSMTALSVPSWRSPAGSTSPSPKAKTAPSTGWRFSAVSIAQASKWSTSSSDRASSLLPPAR